MGTRRKFSAEFKREAVALTAPPDVSVAHVARELGIGANLLGRWRRERHAEGTQAFRGTGVARDASLGDPSPALLTAVTRKSNSTPRGWLLINCSVSVDVPASSHSPSPTWRWIL